MKKLQLRLQEAQERQSLVQSLIAETGSHQVIRELGPSGAAAKKQRSNRGRPSISVIEDAQRALLEMELKGKFTCQAINAESEYPTLLTRLPIFSPGRRSRQKGFLDKDNAIPFQTSWGTGRKHGPPLTVYDEDTLIALTRLRQKRLQGKAHDMPVPVSEIFADPKKQDVNVHVVQCMITDIQKECRKSCGGANLKDRLDSVKRLSAVAIEFSADTNERYLKTGTTIKLFDIYWQAYSDNAVLYIQFPPIMASWLEREYTYINWSIRNQLTDTGKAIHRFLSSQKKCYKIGVKKLMAPIGFTRSYGRMVMELKETMTRLKDLGWVDAWEIEGTGRSTPHILHIARS